MSKKTLDSFWIDLTLRHPDCDPNTISQKLGLQPQASIKAGQSPAHKTSMWTCNFREGFREPEFAQGLEDFLSLLEMHEEYLRDFTAEGGEITLGLNQNVGPADGAIFTLQLDAFFLNVLGFHGVGLNIQAWSAQQE